MISSSFVGLFMAVIANASPIGLGPILTDRDLNSTIWTPKHVMQPDEVILYGKGRMEVVKQNVYEALMKTNNYALDNNDDKDDFLNFTATPEPRSVGPEFAEKDARGIICALTTSLIVDRKQTFIDWDVQMSPVAIGTPMTAIDVFVSKGYTVTNQISVSAGLDWTFIKDKLAGSVGVDYTRSWATATVINLKGTVTNGWSGCMITKPITIRRSGRVFRGCIGKQTQTGTFIADSHDEASYAGVSWVAGAITFCYKAEYPLSRCTGQGDFI